ncbi:MAG: hypothetical protein QNJ75_03145 [Acidimicrobiia bacterium]|nr:hypothetical protein [Acidimicrobiia bacterium]
MNDRDPAFLWETEALRSAAHRVAEAEIDAAATNAEDRRWVTLREASRETGIPVETLRKWARRATVPTYLAPTNRGTTLRMVDLDGVERRAVELGRATKTEPATGASDTSEPAATPPGPTEETPPGTMIVPIDAWNKMLNQLGNLHEAGQQLAEARERAVKAETEATFLRERLAELRNAGSAVPQSPPTDEQLPPEEAAVQPEKATVPPEKVWQFFVRRFRDRNLG